MLCGMDTEFRPINGYEGIYSVSIDGRVKSIQRTKTSYGGSRRIPVLERILKSICRRDGYCVVQLSKHGERKQAPIHRLVATAWISEPANDRRYVNHKDGCKTNNHVSNLEWCSPAENFSHAVSIGLHANPIGSTNDNAKLTDDDVLYIRSLPYRYGLINELASRFKVGRLCIGRIRRRVSWKHI
jgi:hypothetical protein